MTYHFQEHGAVCAECGKRLLPGGTPEQRPHEVRLPDGDFDDVPVMMLVCKACFDKEGRP